MQSFEGTNAILAKSLTHRQPGVVEIKRSGLKVIANLLRNPLAMIPPAAYDEKVVLTRDFGRLRVYVSDPALIQDLLVRSADRLAKSEEMKRVLGSALGEGLLTADGAAWRWQRQAVAPAFQHDRLAQLLPPMIAAAEATRDRWLELPPNSVVDVGHEMMQTTFAIILDTMMSGREGIDAAGVERGVSDFLSATAWMFALAVLKAPRWLPFPGRERARAGTRFMRSTLRSRIAARRTPAAGAEDLVGRLIGATDPETGRQMTNEEITDNILTFIAAGHETTAVALSWTFALLADHPACDARLRAEIDAVTGGGPVLPQHIAELTYTKQVVNEAMRLYPPAPMIARAVERECDVGGVRLPVGSIVFVPIFALHRHNALWPEPEIFDPDRFAPDATRGRHRYAFMPFGAGPRVCIGNAFALMEAVAILAVLVKALRLERVDPELPKPQMQVTLRPERPIRMTIVPRATAA